MELKGFTDLNISNVLEDFNRLKIRHNWIYKRNRRQDQYIRTLRSNGFTINALRDTKIQSALKKRQNLDMTLASR